MIKKIIVVGMIIYSFSVLTFQLSADERVESADKKAIVFMLDASNSMNSNDHNRLGIDNMAQLIYSLPSDYEVGLVAYNDQVVVSTGLMGDEQRVSVVQAAEAIKYTGYTNAGAGLEKAVEILSEDQAVQKTIIILSDGEIIMQEENETLASVAQFQQSVKKAKEEDILIHVVGLGEEMGSDGNTIFSASEETGGSQYYAPLDTDLQKIVDELVLDKLKIKKTTVALLDATGEQETFTIELPSEQMSKGRILITSQAPIDYLQANFNADSGKVFKGKHYSVIELDHPTMPLVGIRFQGQQGSQVTIDMITEYALMAKAEVTYVDTELTERIQRQAQVTVSFYDAFNPNQQLFTEAYFNNISLPLRVDDEQVEGVLIEGNVIVENEVEEDRFLTIDFDYSKFQTNIVSSEPIRVSLEGPPELVKPPDYRPLWLLGSIFLLFTGGILVGIIYKYRQSKRQVEPAIPLPSKYNYYGKFNIYVTHSPSGEDISPRTYDLFRVPPSEVISLKTVIEKCQINEEFEGADKIFFRSGANRTLTLTNHSDCTLLKNRELLMKNHSYQFHIDERVDITFEDERSEMMLQYRNVKPNELRM